MRRLVCLGLAAALSGGCEFPTSSRNDFKRTVTIPPDAAPPADAPVAPPGDGGATPDAAPAMKLVAFRASVFTIERPDGLVDFQDSHITPAVLRNGLNFMVVTTEAALMAGGELPLQLGSADPRGAVFAPIAQYPLGKTMGRLAADQTLTSDPPVDFVVLARLPFASPVSISGGKITAHLGADRTLTDGLITGVVRGDVAATTLLDLQSDNDPSNDTPLINLLGNADVDTDGDGTPDSFSLRVHFTSSVVEFVQ